MALSQESGENSANSTETPSSDGSANPNGTNSGGVQTPSDSNESPATDAPADFESGFDMTGGFERLGKIKGWAGHSKDANAYYLINFYLDGDAGTGTLLGSVTANLYEYDNDLEEGHAFIFYIDSKYIDRKAHNLYAYAVIAGKEVALKGSPLAITPLAPKGGAAQTIYESIGFSKSTCRGCHSSFSYSNRWEFLATSEGEKTSWSATDNALYNKVKAGHLTSGRPNICQNIDCDAVVKWWKAEFE